MLEETIGAWSASTSSPGAELYSSYGGSVTTKGIQNCVEKDINTLSMTIKSEMKYKVISSDEQYVAYCKILESLTNDSKPESQDEIDLLCLLIETWDKNRFPQENLDPVQIIKLLMKEHQLKASDLSSLLRLTKSTVSKVLNYKKGLSKDSIRLLADHFKISQEALNRPYPLNSDF